MTQFTNGTKKEDAEALEEKIAENLDEAASFDDKSAFEQLNQLSKEEIIEGAIKQQQLIVEFQTKNNELTSLCKRIQADFDNYRKRNNENLKRVRSDAATDVIERFLPTLDIIDQAIQMITDAQILSGIKMMQRQLLEVFASYDVVEIDALDKDFDPMLHEAVISEENKEKAGKILEVMRKGYKMGDKVLRYSAVKVAN